MITYVAKDFQALHPSLCFPKNTCQVTLVFIGVHRLVFATKLISAILEDLKKLETSVHLVLPLVSVYRYSNNLGGISDSPGKEEQVGFGILKIGPSVAGLLQF